MAIEKTVNINVDSKRAVKSLEELGGTFEDVYGEMQPLNTQIGELEDRLYEMSLRGEQGTKEFKDLTSQVGKMRKTIIDTDLAVDGMSQNLAQAGTGAVMGLASGFELAQGSMAAFGVEGQAIEETLLRVQSAMAISQGLQGIREAIPSFRNLSNQVKNFGGSIMSSVKSLGAFQKAMIATGIGAIIAAVGLLAANWDTLKASIFGASEAQQANNAVTDTAIENAAEELSALDRLKKTINDENVSRQDKLSAVKDLQKEYPDLLTNVDAEKLSTQELNSVIEENSRLVMLQAKLKATQELRTAAYKEMIEEETAAMQGNNAGIMEYIQSALFNTNVQAEANQQTQENIKSKEEEIAIYDEMGASFEKQIALIKQQTEVTKENEEETKQAAKSTKETVVEQKRQEFEEISSLEIRELELTQWTNEEKQKLNDEALLNMRLANIRFRNQEIEEEKRAAEEQKKIDQQVSDAKYNIAESSLSAVNNLVMSFAGENEKAQKKAFQVQKAINIAQAVMDTYKSANAIFASTAANPITVANPAAPFIAAGAAVAAGLANVASIARQEFQGGSAGGGGGSNAPTLNAGAGGGSNPATFNVVGNSGTNQLAESLGSQPMKAYVVSGDVSTAQEMERAKIQQASI